MHKFWVGVAKFLAVLLSIVLVLAAVGAITLTVVDRRLLSAATYKSILKQQQIYARLPRVLAEQVVQLANYNPCSADPLRCSAATPEMLACASQTLSADRVALLKSGEAAPTPDELKQLQACVDKFESGAASASGVPAFAKTISASDWETILTGLLPSQTLQATTENVIDQTFNFLNGRQPQVTLDLTAFKQHLTGQPAVDSLLTLVRSQPACTVDQAATLLGEFLAGQPVSLLCRPPEEILTQITPLIQQQLSQAADAIPNSLVLFPSPSTTPAAVTLLVNAMRWGHLGLRLGWDLPLLCLLLISLLVVRDPKGWLRWWGIPLFIAGVLTILLSALSTAAFEQIWVNALAGQIPASISLGTLSLIHDLLRALAQVFLTSISFWGLLLAILAAGMLVGSAFIKSAPRAVEEPLPPA